MGVRLDFRPFDLRLTHRWTIASRQGPGGGGGSDFFRVVLVELRDAAGIIGLGESAPSTRYGEDVETVLAFLRRVDPARLSFTDVPGSLVYLESLSRGDSAAKCALDIALLDGAAQIANQTLGARFGLGFTEGRHITSFSIGLDTPEVIRRKVAAAEDYPVLKLKVGGPADRENLRALRDVAPTKPVRVDANEAWATKEEALRQIEELASDGHVEFVEQPMPVSVPLVDWAWLKARSPLPIMADESYPSAAQAAWCAEACHAVNVKLVKTGGITGAYAALQAARAAGLKTMLGCMIESSILISAAAHLADLTDYLDLDGNILTSNDPYAGVTAVNGLLSFATAPRASGLRVAARV